MIFYQFMKINNLSVINDVIEDNLKEDSDDDVYKAVIAMAATPEKEEILQHLPAALID